MPLARSARTTSRARPSLDHRRNADTGCYCHAGARARPNRSSPCWHTARPSAYLAPAHTDTGWWPRVLALAVSLTRCTSHESSGRRYLCAERIENSVCRSWDRIRFHWPLIDGDPVWGWQPSGLPCGISIWPVDIEYQAGDVRRRVVLNMAIAQRGNQRADQQPL